MNAFVAPPDFSKNFEAEKEIQDDDFVYFQSLILNIAGISLGEKKRDLLKTRLGPYVRNNNFKDYTSYRKFLENLPKNHEEWQKLINLITTNKTDFFREPAHFDFIEETLIPQWIKAGKKEINVWSAASSSGEEAYTLAMILEKKLPKDIAYKIHASDIDTNILDKAKNGVYSVSKEHEIPDVFRNDSIDLGMGEIVGWFRIKKHLKSKVTFFVHNLVSEELPTDHKFDLILCRNVMIYFPKEVVGTVATKLYKASASDGYLFIGHSESIQANKTSWIPAAASIYRKS